MSTPLSHNPSAAKSPERKPFLVWVRKPHGDRNYVFCGSLQDIPHISEHCRGGVDNPRAVVLLASNLKDARAKAQAIERGL